MGREIQTIRRCSLCVFNLVIDVLSRFMLGILWDDKDEPFEQWRQVKHPRLKCAAGSRNLLSRARRPAAMQKVGENVLCLCAGETAHVAHNRDWLTEDKKNRMISQGHMEPLT